MSISRKNFVLGIIAALVPGKAAAQVQTVGNHGQIVSTGPVWVDQDAAGNQVVTDAHGNIIATQAIGNDLQVVSTDSVTVGQRAAGSQTISGGSSGICEPGEYVIHDCGISLCTDACEWTRFQCPNCKPTCKKC